MYALARNAGSLFAVGEFDNVGGVFTRSILRANPATLAREPLEPGATTDGQVQALMPLADGRILAWRTRWRRHPRGCMSGAWATT